MDRTTHSKILNEFTAISDLKTANGLNNTKQFESEIEKVLKPLIESGNVLRRVQYDKGEGLRKVKYAYDASSEVQKAVSAALQAVQNSIIPGLSHDPENPGMLIGTQAGEVKSAPLYIEQYDKKAFDSSKAAMIKESGKVNPDLIDRQPIKKKYSVTSERILDPKARAYVQKSIVESGGSFSTHKATGVSTYTAPSGRTSDVTRLAEFVDAADTKYLKGLSSASALAEGASPATVEERSKANLLRQMRIREASSKAVEDELQNDPDNPHLIMRALAEKDAINRVQKRQLRQDGNNPYSVAFSDNVQAGLRKSDMRKKITDEWMEDNPTSYLAMTLKEKKERQDSTNPYSDAFSNKLSSSLAASDMRKKLTSEWIRANPASELAMSEKEKEDKAKSKEKTAFSKRLSSEASGIGDMLGGITSGAISVLVSISQTMASTMIKIYGAVTKIMDSTQKISLGSSALNIDSPTLRGYEVMAGKMGFKSEPKKFENIFRGVTNSIGDIYSPSYSSSVSSLTTYIPSTLTNTLALAQGGAKNAIPIMNSTMAAFATNAINGRRGEADVNGSLSFGRATSLASSVIEGSFLGKDGADVFNKILEKMESTGFLKGKTSISESDWASFTSKYFGATSSDIIMPQQKQDIIINLKEQLDASIVSIKSIFESVLTDFAIALKNVIPLISNLGLFILGITNPLAASAIKSENKVAAQKDSSELKKQIQNTIPLMSSLLEQTGSATPYQLAQKTKEFFNGTATEARAQKILNMPLSQVVGSDGVLLSRNLALYNTLDGLTKQAETGNTSLRLDQASINYEAAGLFNNLHNNAVRQAGMLINPGLTRRDANNNITEGFTKLKLADVSKENSLTWEEMQSFNKLQQKIKDGAAVMQPFSTYLDGFSDDELRDVYKILRLSKKGDSAIPAVNIDQALTARAMLKKNGDPNVNMEGVLTLAQGSVASNYDSLIKSVVGASGSVIQGTTIYRDTDGHLTLKLVMQDPDGREHTRVFTKEELINNNLSILVNPTTGKAEFTNVIGQNTNTQNKEVE